MKTDDVESALRHLDGHQHVFQRLGQIWVLKYEGKMVLMEDARGMISLPDFWWNPDTSFPQRHSLPRLPASTHGLPQGRRDTSSTMRHLHSYRTRYLELQEDIEEALLMSDHGRIAKLESEQEALEIEIAKATGLGGKKRERRMRIGSVAMCRWRSHGRSTASGTSTKSWDVASAIRSHRV